MNQASIGIILLQDGSEQKDYTHLSGNYYIPKSYARTELPKNVKEQPVAISVDIAGGAITEVNDVQFTLSMRMYIGFHWEDSRITKLPPSSKDEKTFLDLQFSKVLWTPHIDIYNLREMISFNALKKDLAGDEVYLPYQYISI